MQGSGSAVEKRPANQSQVDELLVKASQLPLPQQLLPPPPVRDDMASALQGAQVMHDLRTALGGILLTIEENAVTKPEEEKPNDAGTRSDESSDNQAMTTADDGKQMEDIVGDLERNATSIDDFSVQTQKDAHTEQQRWARLGIDFEALNAVIEQCTGGKQLTHVLDKQTMLLQLIEQVEQKSIRLKLALDKNGEQARRTTRALEKLDRIHVALSDVQDTLESAVATANILGASHFAHDDEMCSFKNFLKHNPPNFS